MKKGSSYNRLLKKAKIQASPELFKLKKKKTLQSKADKMSDKMTSPEKIFSQLLTELNVVYDLQKVIDNKIYDFYIPSKNMLIEIHGDYWHANPIVYENKILNKTQLRNVKNDKFKTTLAIGRGYLFEISWEYDLNKNYEEEKERFKKILRDE